MKRAKHAGLLLSVVPFLAGCSGFWQAPSTSGSTGSGGCTTNCTTASSGAFYVLSTTPQIAGASVVSGVVNTIPGSPWQLTSTPYSMAMSPNGAFLYVSTTGGIFVYPISNGGLGAATTISPDVNGLAIQIDSTGTWLIEAQQGVGQVTMAAIPLNSSTGGVALTGIEVTTGYNVTATAVQSKLAISPDDKYIFVPLGGAGVLVVPFAAGVAAGVSPFGGATLIPVANSGGSALSVAVDPQGRVFYVGEVAGNSGGTSGGLLAYDYSSWLTGTLKQISGSPIASGGLAPNAILPDAAGNYVYVANGQGVGNAGNISSFSISASGSTYTVAAGSTVSTGTQPLSLAEDSSGQFLFDLGGVSNPHFDAFTFDSTTPGKLDAQISTAAAALPVAVVATP